MEESSARSIFMNPSDRAILRVTYMELRAAPAPMRQRIGPERITRERLSRAAYLDIYQKVGEPLRWDQRLQMPDVELEQLLDGESLSIYVLRNDESRALGFCEFDRRKSPNIELKNFGLVREAQGRGLGSWVLSVSLREEWISGAARIWLHTDTWDHPRAIGVYERAGFHVYAVRDAAASQL